MRGGAVQSRWLVDAPFEIRACFPLSFPAGQLYTKARNNLGVERTEKLIFIKGNDKAYTARDVEVVLAALEAE